MRYDSSPPVYYDSPTAFYDLPDTPSSQPTIKMKYATLKLESKTLDQKLDLTTDLAAALTTHVAVYASPNPPPATLTGKVTAIRAKQGEITAAQTVLDTKLAELDALEVNLDNSLAQETAYIQETSQGIEANITLIGVGVRSTAAPLAAPGKVQNFRLMPGTRSGEVKCAGKPDAMAASYEYDWATDPTKEENWKHLDTSSGCRHTFTGLTTGQVIWVRARVVGKKKTGKGPWSDPATITVP